MSINWREHIESNPDVLAGKPSIKGTRISVELIPGWLAQGWTHDMLIRSYPDLTAGDILAASAFAASS